MVRKVVLLAAFIAYAIIFILAVPELSKWLGTSPVGQVIVVLLIAPLIILSYYFSQAFKRHGDEAGLSEKSTTENRTELLWRGQLSLKSSFWFGYVPSVVFAIFVGQYAWSRIKAPGANQVDAAVAAIILIAAVLGLAMFGTWRSGNNFTGNRIWISVSRAVMIVGAIGCVFAVIA